MTEEKKKNTGSTAEWDERRDKIRELIKDHIKTDDSVLKNKRNKAGIEGQLESSDEKLKELIEFGEELVTNIKVAGEMRKIQHRKFEEAQKKALRNDLSQESSEAIARFNSISDKWSELKNYKEPVVMFNQLENQKERIQELMISKDNIIDKCQQEINRVSDKYYADQEKQAVEICVLVERIDSQVELIKQAYKNHLDLLQDAIEEERLIMAKTESAQWDELFNTLKTYETRKLLIEKDKEKIYVDELEKNCREQQEITRDTRIRLERDAEALQLELRSTQNNVLMNSEKLDYNYQVLKKRNQENVVINNQQKRRLAKFKETIAALKFKINTIKEKAHGSVKKMSTEVEKLYTNVSQLEEKSKQFTQANKKKYSNVWNINYQEAHLLANRILEIDRLLYAQQLGVDWVARNIDGIIHNPFGNTSLGQNFKSKEDQNKRNSSRSFGKSVTQQVAEIRLLRSILEKISDRAGFLIEDKLLKILEPYTDEEKCIVRIDNIFNALKISEYKDITSLIDYFLPYSWCPNCSNDLSSEILTDYDEAPNSARGRPSQALEIEKSGMSSISVSASDICSLSTDDIERNITSILTSKKRLIRPEKTNTEEALKISEYKDITSLIDYFLPYSWCPNCSNDLSSEILTDYDEAPNSARGRPSQALEIEKSGMSSLSVSASDICSLSTDDIERNITSILTSKKRLIRPEKTNTEESICSSHYLFIKPAFVLTALRNFTESYLKKHDGTQLGRFERAIVRTNQPLAKDSIEKCWSTFLHVVMTEDNQKLWKTLAHGLDHYLDVLKEREQLDMNCEFLRRQNTELRHLLQKHLPSSAV